jgi:uncharacterized Fe-S cluster-containing protein
MKLKCAVCGKESGAEYSEEELGKLAAERNEFVEELLIICGNPKCKEQAEILTSQKESLNLVGALSKKALMH